MKYIVKVSIMAGDDTFEEEYTGNVYTRREDARKELMEAKNDVSVDSVYIDMIISE